jgi:1-deoxy-D-xylulose-5-phosphate synthase
MERQSLPPSIQSPEQLIQEIRSLDLSGLEALAAEVRQRIISVCLKSGGHLGASLGTVELAIALHRVFHSPKDALIWDVGHQAYAHKLLTGRWEQFDTLRKTGGLAPFLSREESEHDVFGAGHSSTSLSAAVGVAAAKHRLSDPSFTVAIIGDGGLTAGLAYEALNQVGAYPMSPMLVVLNDNQLSISSNVGAIPRMLARGEAPQFFEALGFNVMGPIDGHNLEALVGAFESIRQNAKEGPWLLHVMTQKGHGYLPAEKSPIEFHGVSAAPVSAPVKVEPRRHSSELTYSEVLADELAVLCASDPKVVAITAAMSEGTALTRVIEKCPTQVFDVGIAEPHAVTMAAALATQGLTPVVAIYSTFLQRALDQIIHDVALQKLKVIFAVDRAGLVGADGPTHHGVFDLAYLSMIPGLRVWAPACSEDLQSCLRVAVKRLSKWEGSEAIRYPRGIAVEFLKTKPHAGVRVHFEHSAPEVILVCLGTTVHRGEVAFNLLRQEGVRVSFYSTILAKPIAEGLLQKIGSQLKANPEASIITVEDGIVRGGFGEALTSALGAPARVKRLGIQDCFVAHGSMTDLERVAGIDVESIVKAARS